MQDPQQPLSNELVRKVPALRPATTEEIDLSEKKSVYLHTVVFLIPIVLLQSLFLYIDRQPGYVTLITASVLLVSLLLLRQDRMQAGVIVMFVALWLVGPLSLLFSMRSTGISVLMTVGYLFLALVVAQTAFSRRTFNILTLLTFISIFLLPTYPPGDPRRFIFSISLVLIIWMIVTVFGSMNRLDQAARQTAQAALRADEERYRIISELVNDFVFKVIVTDDEKMIVEWTAGGIDRILGYEPSRVANQPFILNQYIYAEDQPLFRAHLEDIRQNQDSSADFRMVAKDGSLRWVKVYAHAERDPASGRITTIYGAAQDITERKLADQELVESRQRYEELVNSVDGVVWEVDAETRDTLFVSTQIEEITGYRVECFTADPQLWLDIIHPDDRDQAIANRAAAVQERRNFQNEYRIIAADGRVVWLRDNVSLVPLPGGRWIMRGLSINITASKLAEIAKEEQRRLYDALRETAAVISASLDLDEVLDRILDELYRVKSAFTADIILIGDDGFGHLVRERGFTESGIPRIEAHEQIPIKDMPTFRHMIETGEFNLIYDTQTDPRWRHPEFAPWIRSTVGAPIRLEGETIGFLHLTSDKPGVFNEEDATTLTAFADQVAIAVRNARLYDQVLRYAEKLEEQVRQRTDELVFERERASIMLDSSGEGILYTENSRILYLNPALCEMTGYTADELIGRHVGIIRGDESREVTRQELLRIGKELQREGVWRGESKMRRKNGELVDIGMTTSLLNKHDPTFRAVTLIRDISKEKALQKQQSNLVAYASHELRTPITNLKTRLYLLRRRPENLDEHLEILEQVTERMKRLVEDLLDISRMERGIIPLRRRIVSIGEHVQRIVQIQQPEADRKHLALTYTPPDEPIYVEADPERLAQVVTNLITNAINYTPSGGSVNLAIALGQPKRTVEIRVSDTGVGIAPEHLPYIFQPFYRVVSHVDGTGLGLSIARQIAHMHNGDIRVESTANQGSTFTLILPCVAVSETIQELDREDLLEP